MSFSPPARLGEPYAADVEDFTLSLAARLTAPSLAELLTALAQIRWSRR